MKVLVFCLLLPLAVTSAQDQGGGAISLNKAMEVALERNFQIKVALNNVEREQAGVLAAYGNFAPTLSLNSSWGGGQQFINGVAIGAVGDRSISSSLQANMTLFDGFSNTSSLSSAQANVTAIEHTLGRVRQAVVAQTQRLYYEVLRTRRLLEVTKRNLDYSSQQLARVQETARLGSASLVNVYQQQAQVGTDEVSVVQAQNNYDIANANLASYLALDVTQTYTFEDPAIPSEIEPADFDRQKRLTADLRSLMNQALDRRQDYLSSLQSYRATDASVTVARSGYYPRVSFNGSYQLTGRTQRDPLTDQVTASEIENFGVSRSFNWGINLSLPLFSGFQTNRSVETALVTRMNAEENLRETERNIKVEVRTAVLFIEAAEKNYEASMKSLQYQEQNLKVNQEKYNVGSGTLLDLLFAQNNYTNAQVTKINAVYQYLNAKSQLELAIGSMDKN